MEPITFSDPRQWLAASIFFLALYLAFGASLGMSAAVAVAVMICWACSFGRHWIMNTATAVMMVAFAVALGWLPQPTTWSVVIARLLGHAA